MKSLALGALAAGVLALASPAMAQSPQTYDDGNEGEVTLPLGDLSFADRVVGYSAGNPAPIPESSEPSAVLGVPDWQTLNEPERWVTLGCGGSLVVRFDDNALVDLDGPDLYIFEVGPDVEGTRLAISSDGKNWTDVGEISGGRADVDIGSRAAPGESYSHVRLTDDNEGCSGRWPGADIDAVAAIGSAARIVMDGAVLFDLDSTSLKSGAEAALDRIAKRIAASDIAEVRIVGHTDSQGADAYNEELSTKRAEGVKDYLAALPAIGNIAMTVRGAGESRPVATNDTREGRQRNRRVEIILVPGT